MTGIGGQGIQLAAQVLALAAVAEGREAMLFGSYGGMMRGGSTAATLVVADAPIEAPPTVGSAWSAMVMHHDYWEPTRDRLRNGVRNGAQDTVVLVNTTVFSAPIETAGWITVGVPATDIAAEVGSVAAASLVLLGAYAETTGLVRLASLAEALPHALPVYRQHTLALNHAALAAGAAQATPGLAPAWTPGVAR
jgi:Pyruvate/2-oxoacid:ferredoxin oxidoreductase gamma subunit